MHISKITAGFLLLILPSFASLLILPLKIVDFEKILYSGPFKTYSKLIKYSKWQPPLAERCQNFDFQIALTYLFYPILIWFVADCMI